MVRRRKITADIAAAALKVALRPLVRLALRSSLQFMDLVELLKSVFLEVAAEELTADGERVSVSRLSVMTGVHRKDATRLYRDGGEVKKPGDTLTRVIGHWRQSSRFASKPGQPRVLGCEGNESEFAELVREVTSDVAPYTVLNELERRELVERTARGVKLATTLHILADKDVAGGFALLGSDVQDLLEAASENILEPRATRNLHLKTQFDNIPRSKLPEIREWLLDEGSKFHVKVERYLAQFDRDIVPNRDRSPASRVAFGSFSLSEEKESEEEE